MAAPATARTTAMPQWVPGGATPPEHPLADEGVHPPGEDAPPANLGWAPWPRVSTAGARVCAGSASTTRGSAPPAGGRSDLVLAAAWPPSACSPSSSSAASARSRRSPTPGACSGWPSSTGAALLVGRRRWPLSVASLAALHMLVVGHRDADGHGPVHACRSSTSSRSCPASRGPATGAGWSSSSGVIVVVMFTVDRPAVRGRHRRAGHPRRDRRRHPLRRSSAPSPRPSCVTVLINVVYFGGALITGRNLWSGARQTALLTEQAETITEQADALQTRAVTEERLRIARELHDVVAHHVSVIGIQAAAARRVMGRDPEAAGRRPRGHRGLLARGRQPDARPARHAARGRAQQRPADAEADRAPQPTLADLPGPRRVRSRRRPAAPRSTSSSPSPVRAQTSRPLWLTRSTAPSQEALTNVEKHSTAAARLASSSASRRRRRPASPRSRSSTTAARAPGTSGSGLGQLGIRERAASHRGTVEVGPRPTGATGSASATRGRAAEPRAADPTAHPGLRSVS